MTVTEESRYHLHQQLDQAVGEKGATTMMELLPPVGWADVATKRDLDQQSERHELMIRGQIAGVRTEIAGVRTEIAEVKSSFEKTMRHQLTVLLSAMVSIAGLLIALSIYGPS